MQNHQLINGDSHDVDYYTPQPIIEAARLTMGGIDLDPASSRAANERVKAAVYFSSHGLNQQWHGRVWLNHPFSRVGNPLWIAQLFREFEAGRIDHACCITFAATSEKWFQPLLRQPQCFLSPRTNYFMPDGTVKRGVTKGSCVTYLGPNREAFRRNFEKLGVVKFCHDL